MKYRFTEFLSVGSPGAESSVELPLSTNLWVKGTMLGAAACGSVGAIIIGEEVPAAGGTVGVRKGEIFRRRQTRRTFLNAKELLLFNRGYYTFVVKRRQSK